MNRLKHVLTSLMPSQHITKVTKDELKEEIDKINDELDKELKDKLDEVLNAKKCTKKLKTKIDELLKNIKNGDEISKDKIEEVVETIKEIQDENLEEELDKECSRYNKFTKSNPAEYINFNEKDNNFRIKIPEEKIKESKKLPKLIEKLKKNFSTKKRKKS